MMLMGCASQPPSQIVKLRPPAALLVCQAQPEKPAMPFTQRDVAEYLLALAYAGHDCRQKLEAIKRWAQD